MDNETLAAMIQAGENRKEALEALYEQNRGLIWKLCRKYSYGLEMEDLMQQAYIGLHRAALEYRSGKDSAFSSYAALVIRRELARYRDSCGQMVRVPEAEQRLYYEHERLARYMEASYGRKPTEQEYSRYLGVSVEKVRKMEKLAVDHYITSLDTPVSGEDGKETTLGELQAGEESGIEDALERYAGEQLSACLWGCVGELPERLQDVLRLRTEGITLARIGAMLGVSFQRVRAMYGEGLRMLRKKRAVKELGRDWLGCA